MTINIPNPCHENWNKMTPRAQGRFCDSCEQTVIDFSVMNKAEITSFFKEKATQSICGRFKSSQLINSGEQDSALKKKNKLWMFVAACFSFLISKVGYTQGKPFNFHDSLPSKQTDSVSITPFIKKNKIFKDTINLIDSSTQITGRLLKEDGSPFAFATVLLNDSVFGSVSDSNGKFSFSIPFQFGNNRKLIIQFAGEEFHTLYLKNLHLKYNDLGEIKLKQITRITKGVMTVTKKVTFSNKTILNNSFLRMFR